MWPARNAHESLLRVLLISPGQRIKFEETASRPPDAVASLPGPIYRGRTNVTAVSVGPRNDGELREHDTSEEVEEPVDSWGTTAW